MIKISIISLSITTLFRLLLEEKIVHEIILSSSIQSSANVSFFKWIVQEVALVKRLLFWIRIIAEIINVREWKSLSSHSKLTKL